MDHSDSVYETVSNGGSVPSQSTLKFADDTAFIQSVDVYNYSTLTVTLSVNGALFTIYPFRREVLSVPPSKAITVNFAGQATANGFVYIYFTDTQQVPASFSLADAANAGVIACASVSTTIQPNSIGFAPDVLFKALVEKYASSVLAHNNTSSNTFARRMALTHLAVSGLPAVNYWQLVPVSASGGANAINNILTYSDTAIDADFSYPYPLYDVSNDPIGNEVDLKLYYDTTGVSGGPWTVWVTIQCLLT